jgi:hypothetical protein
MLDELVGMMDYVMARLDARLDGMDDDEHHWKPMDGAWDVLADGTVEHADPYGRPAEAPPLTTIAWRLWHIANESFCGFAPRAWDVVPLEDVGPAEWFASAATSRAKVQEAWRGLRAGIVAKGDEHLQQTMGPAWGPYAEATFAGLLLHVFDETVHHAAEVGMLRDLYRVRTR